MELFVPTASDLAHIQRLLEACELPFSDLTPAHLSDFLALRRAGDLVGAVGVERFGDAGLLRSLAVDTAWRGRGIGQRLIDEAEALARRRDVRVLYLLTTTAVSFFRGRGYLPVERSAVPPPIRGTREFDTLCPGDAACLMRSLIAEQGRATDAPGR